MTDNRHRILGYLFRRGPTARAALSEALGIRPNTVGEICADLIEKRAIQEADSTRQRNVPLAIQPDHLYAVGAGHVEAGFRIVVMDAACAMRAEATVPLSGVTGRSHCEALGDGIKDLLHTSGITRSRVIGIGFANLAISDRERGVAVRAAHLPGWSDVPVRAILTERTGLHTHLTGCSNALAALELRRIAAPGWDTALCAWLDRFIGLAVFLKGEPLWGNHPAFGEIGHLVVQPGGAPCQCGGRGCLETVASIPAILRRVGEGIARGAEFPKMGPEVAMEDVVANAQQGNKLALRVLEEAGGAAGRAIAFAVNLFGISNVLLMGTLTQAGVVVEAIQGAVRRDCIAPLNADACFRTSESPPEDAAEGAAYLALCRHFGGTPSGPPVRASG